MSAAHRILAALLACFLTGSAAFGQAGVGDWKNVLRLGLNAPIAVKTVAGDNYIGYLVSADAVLLVIDTDERGFPGRLHRRRQIRREAVRQVRMWARRASMLFGGGIGAGIGAGIGGAIEASAKSNEDRGVALAVLTVLGFTLGLLVGRHNHIVKGRLVYAAP